MQSQPISPVPPLKTAEQHLEMLVQSVSLMLWHAYRWSHTHPKESLFEILDKRVDIFRRTELHPGEIYDTMEPDRSPEWQELKAALVQVAEKSDTAEQFEKNALPLLIPLFPGRVERDLADLHEGRIFHQYKENCLHFSLDQLWNTEEQSVDFHIANNCYPRSLFDDPDYLPDCLLRMADKAEVTLDAKVITTNSWLNSFPGWLRRFPPIWSERCTPGRTDTEDHLGFWGQLLTAQQTFAHAIGRKMRRTGELPYPMCRSWCTIEELRQHLQSKSKR